MGRMLFDMDSPRTVQAAQSHGFLRRGAQCNGRADSETASRWLGEEVAYSCAYFESSDDDIDTAQEQKFRHICAKLRLHQGERLLDVGCGWGGLLIHASIHHGVRALEITVSAQQKQFADQRVAEMGLGDQVAIELKDYRELPNNVSFDRIVSVGMLEHLGKENVPQFVRCISRLLKPGGIGLLHYIGRTVEAPPNPWLNKYIFPGHSFPTLAAVAEPMGRAGLHITDVEGLRMHYALTLDCWIKSSETHFDAVCRMYNETFARMWRLYLESSAASFRYGNHTLWQIQFTGGLKNDMPLTRAHLYR